MNNEGSTSTSVLGLIVPVIVCAVALAVGYGAHKAAREAKTGYQKDIAAVRADLDGLKAQIGSLSNLVAARRPSTTVVAASGSGDWSSGKDDMTDSLMALESSLSHIEKTLDKAGLEGVASNDLDQTALRAIIDERKELITIDARRDALDKLRTAQTATDLAKNGAELTNLYALARSRFGRDRTEADDQQRDAAIKELEQKYPEAYATAKALGDVAIGAMFRQNTEQVEQYYQKLGDMKQAPEVVNEWGLQTMPAIEYYLADKYIEQKRYSDAEKLISSLEKKYPDAIIPSMMMGRRGRGGDHHGPQLVTVPRATTALRQKMQGE